MATRNEKIEEITTTPQAITASKEAAAKENVKYGDLFMKTVGNALKSSLAQGVASTKSKWQDMTGQKYLDIHKNANMEIPEKQELKKIPEPLKIGDTLKDNKGQELKDKDGNIKKANEKNVNERNQEIAEIKNDNKGIIKENKVIDKNKAIKNEAKGQIKGLKQEFKNAKNFSTGDWASIGDALKSWQTAMKLDKALNGKSTGNVGLTRAKNIIKGIPHAAKVGADAVLGTPRFAKAVLYDAPKGAFNFIKEKLSSSKNESKNNNLNKLQNQDVNLDQDKSQDQNQANVQEKDQDQDQSKNPGKSFGK